MYDFDVKKMRAAQSTPQNSQLTYISLLNFRMYEVNFTRDDITVIREGMNLWNTIKANTLAYDKFCILLVEDDNNLVRKEVLPSNYKAFWNGFFHNMFESMWNEMGRKISNAVHFAELAQDVFFRSAPLDILTPAKEINPLQPLCSTITIAHRNNSDKNPENRKLFYQYMLAGFFERLEMDMMDKYNLGHTQSDIKTLAIKCLGNFKNHPDVAEAYEKLINTMFIPMSDFHADFSFYSMDS